MGGSRIAIRLAALAGEEFRIKIIDTNIDTCRMLPEKCPDCNIVHGDARDIEVLREEGIDDTDAFVALSNSSETNILACLTAKEFGVHKTIAEVEDLQFISEAEGLNIGTVINKKLLASSKDIPASARYGCIILEMPCADRCRGSGNRGETGQ